MTLPVSSNSAQPPSLTPEELSRRYHLSLDQAKAILDDPDFSAFARESVSSSNSSEVKISELDDRKKLLLLILSRMTSDF